MGSDLKPRNISTFYIVSEQPIGGTTGRKVARPVLSMIIDLVATDLPLAITHDLCDQSYDLFHQSYVLSTNGPPFQHFRSQVGFNLVVSQVWLGFEHDHDLAATDLPLAIIHDLCDQSYDLSDQSYVLSTIGQFFGRR